ncbi:MAG TPA: metallophosphoesterase [Longilinea sp.]|nr:metallophosphoesterase [Longilinea sp.]
MRTLKIIAAISTIISGAFIVVVGSAYPLWKDIQGYIGVSFPLLLILIVVAFLFSLYCLWIAAPKTKLQHRLWLHYAGMALFDTIMVALVVVLIGQLGSNATVLTDTFLASWPYAIWFGAIIVLLWLTPLWKPLQNRVVRISIIVLLAIIALVWISLPWQLRITQQPVVFIQPGGVSISWATNMNSISRVDYGSTTEMGETAVRQSDGLVDVNNIIQTVFIPMAETSGNLYFQAASQGLRSFELTNVVTTGAVSSSPLEVTLPEPGSPLSIVAFSDIHAQVTRYQEMSDQIDWSGVDEVIYIGDLLNYTISAEQAAQTILALPTGAELLPRVYVRGNHETRGEGARSLDEWLLPPDGSWYYTFSSGNVFFIVLDTGEDKIDTHPEYSGMNDFADYYRQETAWLQEVVDSQEYQDADYRVVLMHVPPFTGNDPEAFGYISPDLDPIIELLRQQTDIDLVMSGHIHEGGIWMPDETGFPFPVVTCGGQQAMDMAAVTADFGEDGITLQVLHRTGAIWDEAFLPNN